jgi:hypothetical protein
MVGALSNIEGLIGIQFFSSNKNGIEVVGEAAGEWVGIDIVGVCGRN